MTERSTRVVAFPLTPLKDGGLDEDAFREIVARLADVGVDGLGVMGSTGVGPYLSVPARARVVELAVAAGAGLPVTAGVGALATADVIDSVRAVMDAGATSVLLQPLGYHALSDDEVFGLYADVAEATGAPIVVYDNPRTTGFAMSDALLARLAQIDAVVGVKAPGREAPLSELRARTAELRVLLGKRVEVGVSGDKVGAAELHGGRDVWHSGLAGVLPEAMLALARADYDEMRSLVESWAPLWEAQARFGGAVRVAAAVAAARGWVRPDCLPRPLLPLLDDESRELVARLREAGALPG